LDCLKKRKKKEKKEELLYTGFVWHEYPIFQWRKMGPSVTNHEAIPHQLIWAYFGLKVVQLPICNMTLLELI